MQHSRRHELIKDKDQTLYSKLKSSKMNKYMKKPLFWEENPQSGETLARKKDSTNMQKKNETRGKFPLKQRIFLIS